MNYVLNKEFGFTLAASIFTSIGLGRNDLPHMIGGMVVSPLGGPIMRMAKEGDFMTNLIQLIILISVCVVMGIIYFNVFLAKDFVPTERMMGIGNPKGTGYMNDIIYGLVVGACLFAISDQFDDTSIGVMIGVTIGVTIFPAFVNAGIAYGAGAHNYVDHEGNNLTLYGNASMIVGLIYLLTIFAGYVGSEKAYYIVN